MGDSVRTTPMAVRAVSRVPGLHRSLPMRFVLLGLCALAACDMGEIDTSSHVGADAPSGGSNEIDAAVHTVDAPATFACKDKVLSVGTGHHNAGMDCLDGCHNHGFSFAGTLYMPGTTTPVVGATITAFDAT